LVRLLVTSGVGFSITQNRINSQAEESFVDRLRKTVTRAEQSSTSAEVSNNVTEIARLARESSNGAHEAAKRCDELPTEAMPGCHCPTIRRRHHRKQHAANP
jgi:methyl-accepting chemotaxis protein